MILGMQCSDASREGGGRVTQEAKAECVRFHSGQGATMPHGRPLQRGATLPWMKTGL